MISKIQTSFITETIGNTISISSLPKHIIFRIISKIGMISRFENPGFIGILCNPETPTQIQSFQHLPFQHKIVGYVCIISPVISIQSGIIQWVNRQTRPTEGIIALSRITQAFQYFSIFVMCTPVWIHFSIFTEISIRRFLPFSGTDHQIIGKFQVLPVIRKLNRTIKCFPIRFLHHSPDIIPLQRSRIPERFIPSFHFQGMALSH